MTFRRFDSSQTYTLEPIIRRHSKSRNNRHFDHNFRDFDFQHFDFIVLTFDILTRSNPPSGADSFIVILLERH